MKRSRHICAILCALLLAVTGLLLPRASARGIRFSDVDSGAWYADYVQQAADEGLMSGTGSNRFSPDTPLTRAMFVTILGRLHGVDPDDFSQSTAFFDAPVGSWYAPYVNWASDSGIVTGYRDWVFGSDDPITREQMATILARYIDFLELELPAGEDIVSSFRDSGKVSSWARQGVELMRRTGILSGDQNRNFRPGANALRSEAATIFVRLSQILNGNPEPATSYEAMEQVTDNFRAVERTYADSDGVIPSEKAEDALQALKDAADQLLEDGDITYWGEDSGQITYQLKNGGYVTYFPAYEGADEFAGTGGGIISVYQPVLTEEGFANASKTYGSVSDAAKEIISASDKYTSGTNLTNDAVTLESLKQWQPGSIIMWIGHGSYDGLLKECFITGEEVTEKSMERYEADHKAGRLGISTSANGKDYYNITPKFFDYYYDQDDLKGTLIFMGACNSLRDDTMANVMTEKLGATYIGSTSIIYIPYLHNLELTFLERMATKGPDGSYYTAQEALDYAKLVHPLLFYLNHEGTRAKNYLFYEDAKITKVLLKGDGSISLNSGMRDRSLRVVGPSGNTGISGATVSLYAKGVGGPALQTATTDAQGYCTLKNLSDSVSYTVSIQAKGYVSRSGVALPVQDPVVIQLGKEATMNITVKSADGEKLGLYEIYVRNQSGATLWEKSNGFSDQVSVTETTTALAADADYKVQASASFYTPVIQSVHIDKDKTTQTVEIELYRGNYGFKGKVVDDASGRPIQGVTAELTSSSGNVYATATTDSTGSFQVMGKAGLVLYTLRLSGSGYETMTDLGSGKIQSLNEAVDLGTIRMTATGGSTQPVEPEPSEPAEPSQPEQDGEYTMIYTADDLKAISSKSGKYKLANDLDLTGYSSSIVGLVAKDSVLDGDGHTLRINQRVQFFGGVISSNYGTIRNLRVSGTADFDDDPTSEFGGICGMNYGLIEDCSFSGTIRSSTAISDNGSSSGGIGGICGRNGGTVRNCTVSGSISLTLGANGWGVGGICGYAETGSVLENCINRATVSVQVTGAYYENTRCAWVGGICGYCNGYEDNYLTDCLNTANITAKTTKGTTRAAGVCPWSGTLEGCANTGACITATGTYYIPTEPYSGSIAYGVGPSRGSICYCSESTILVDVDGTRSVAEDSDLILRSAQDILEMW